MAPDYSKSGINRNKALFQVDPRNPIRTSLHHHGLAISSKKQDVSDVLTSIANTGITSDNLLYGSGVNTFSKTTISPFARQILDDADGDAVRATIGVQDLAVSDTEPSSPVSGDLWLDTVFNVLRVYDGSDWLNVGEDHVLVEVKNASGIDVSKGEPVYVSGTHSSGKPQITLADSNGSGTYPAIGLAYADIADDAEGFVVSSGDLHNLDTSGYSAGDALYLSSTVGALTKTRPTSSSEQVQKVALVTRSHASAGAVIVMGAGRVNDVPNELTALTGVALNAEHLGTFTGQVIADSRTVKQALQDLETAQETGNTEQHSVWWQDYLVSSMTACGWSTKSLSGGSGQAWETITDTSNATGVNELRTNTSATGLFSILTYNNVLIFDNETAYTWEARINVSALSTSSEEYVASFGFSRKFDAAYGDANETDYAMFVYDRSADGDFWTCRTARNGTETATVTDVAPVGDNSTFVVLKVSVNADGSEIVYSINGVTKATHTSNIPSTGDRLGIGLRINKTNGTTNRECRIDWHRFTTTRSAAR